MVAHFPGSLHHFPGSLHHFPGSLHHFPGSLHHFPGSLHHFPGSLHHFPGSLHHFPGSLHHFPGSLHHFPGSLHHFPGSLHHFPGSLHHFPSPLHMARYSPYYKLVFTLSKIRTISMPETCENWFGLLKGCVYYACQTLEICQVLPYSVYFKASHLLWNPLSKTVRSKYSFIWNKWPVNIWNDHQAQK